MKIALVFSSGFHPKQEYMENAIAREFKNLGHELVIITRDRHSDYLNYDETMLPLIGPKFVGAGRFFEGGYLVYRLKTLCFGRNKKFQINPGLFYRLISLNPDLIFFQTVENAYGALQASLAKKITGSKLFFVLNELVIFHRPSQSNKRAIRHRINNRIKIVLEKLSLSTCDRVIAMNEACYDRALELCPKCKNKITSITLGVDNQRIKYRDEFRYEFRKEMKIGNDDILIITSGKILPTKKTDVLLNAIININNPSVYLLVLGNGPVEFINQLKGIAGGFKYHENIIFKSAVSADKLHYYFSASDIAVWVDSATISTLEASAVGIPIIVPDFHGYEHRTKNNNGFKIKRGDLNDLTEKLEVLINNRTLRKEMGVNGRELIDNDLNWGKIANKILNE